MNQRSNQFIKLSRKLEDSFVARVSPFFTCVCVLAHPKPVKKIRKKSKNQIKCSFGYSTERIFQGFLLASHILIADFGYLVSEDRKQTHSSENTDFFTKNSENLFKLIFMQTDPKTNRIFEIRARNSIVRKGILVFNVTVTFSDFWYLFSHVRDNLRQIWCPIQKFEQNLLAVKKKAS
jgi:hypothetical protein